MILDFVRFRFHPALPAAAFVVILPLATSGSASADEYLRVSSPDGAIAQSSLRSGQVEWTDLIPRGHVVTVMRTDLRDPDYPGQPMAEIYSPEIPSCDDPSHPCYVAYDKDTFEPVSLAEVSRLATRLLDDVDRVTLDKCDDSGLSVGMMVGLGEKAGLKPAEQLDRYFSCLQLKQEYTDRYRAEYRGYVSLAEKSFDIPAPFVACILFRESRWDPEAVNPTSHAAGLGQFLSSSFKTIAKITETGKIDPSRLEDLRKEAESDRSPPSRSFALSRLENHELALLWKSYDEAARRLGTSSSPRRYSDPRLDPVQAIGATSLYLARIHSILINAMKEARNPMAEEPDALLLNPEYLAIIGVAYNMGETKLLRELQPVLHQGLSAWTTHLAGIWHQDAMRLSEELTRATADVKFLGSKLAKRRPGPPISSKKNGTGQARASRSPDEKRYEKATARMSVLLERYRKVFEERNYLESIYRCTKSGDGRPLVDGLDDPSKAAANTASCHF